MTDVNYEHIERYLAGEMDLKERNQFEQELERNEDLAQELRFYIYVNDNIAAYLIDAPTKRGVQVASLKFRSSTVNTYLKKNNVSKIRWFAILSIAVITCGFYIWSPWKTTVPSQSTSVKIQQQDLNVLTAADAYKPVMELFNSGQYEEVLPLLNSAIEEHPEDLNLYYYRGLSLLNLGKLGSARKDFLLVYTENAFYQYEAAYYIGLSYTMEEDDYSDTAKEWLRKIPADHQEYSEAQSLLNKL